MRNGNTTLQTTQLNLALQRLELLMESDSQELFQKLQAEKDVHLPYLSQELKKSPGQLKRQLDKLKATGLVYSSKRYPKSYSLNHFRCLKIRLQVEAVVEML
jgi:predicted ArsR family transcriptional regulator